LGIYKLWHLGMKSLIVVEKSLSVLNVCWKKLKDFHFIYSAFGLEISSIVSIENEAYFILLEKLSVNRDFHAVFIVNV
jgi:hypothetical protein